MQVDADFDADADDDGSYRRWCWCWYCLCGHRGCQCWSLSQKLEWSSVYHLQAILTHFLSPKFVLRTVVSKIYNALLISGSSWSFSKLSQRTSQWYTPPPLGVYSCVAGNILGETVSQAFLQVVWISLNIFGLNFFEYFWFEHLWTSLVVYLFYRHIAMHYFSRSTRPPWPTSPPPSWSWSWSTWSACPPPPARSSSSPW